MKVKEHKCKNPECDKQTTKPMYCCKKCCYRGRYLENRQKYIDSSKRWQKNNPEKYKEASKRNNEVFRERHPERYNQLMLKAYHKDKFRWNSRAEVYRLLHTKRDPITMERKCHRCQNTENLRIHCEEFSQVKQEILENIKNKKIYYLCKNCKSE